MDKIKDLTGQRFGKLTVIRSLGRSKPKRGRLWLCQCDCGNTREVPTGRLNSKVGHIWMCEECAKRVLYEKAKENSVKRAEIRREKLHSVWNMMKQRCTNPNNGQYKWYGALGINVCNEWSNSYADFKEWALNNGYKEGLTIDRIDVNGNYCPENCRWITRREQGYNKRDTCYIIFRGKKIPVAKFVYDLGLSYNPIMHYLRTFQEDVDTIQNSSTTHS